MKWIVSMESEGNEPIRISFAEGLNGKGYPTREEALKEFCYEYVATKCQKPEEQISFFESVCRSQDIPSEHSYHWEHKQGESWSSHTLVDDVIAEQKKEEGWEKAIKEAKEKYGYGKPVIRDFSPKEEAEQKKEEQKENVIAYPKALRLKLEVEKKIEDKLYERLAERLKERFEKIENRLTEIEGVLTSIGSPDYDLRKKVEGLEKGLAQLTDTFYICANNETHNYEDLRKRVEAIEHQTGKKDIEEINETLEKGECDLPCADKDKADNSRKQVNGISKNENTNYKECKANPFRCEKCGLEFKVISQERALVVHCPTCGGKPKRIED